MSRIVSYDSEGNEHYPFSDWDHEPCVYLNKFGCCGNLSLNCCGEKCQDPTDITCAGYSTSLKVSTLDGPSPPVTVRLKDVGERVEYKGGSYICTAKIKDSGERTEFPSGAVRDMHAGKGDMASIPWEAILRLSKHYENGAKKYKRWNYRAGINLSSYIDSACRHLAKYQCGCDDEDHLAAAAFNILGAMLVEEIQPELIDLPLREGKNRFCYFDEE